MKKTAFYLIMSAVTALFFVSCGGSKNEKNDTKDTTQTTVIKTIENLKAAITGETTASAKYLAFAEKAKAEGYEEIASLFSATSKAEAIHAENHLKVLEKMSEKFEAKADSFEVKTTKENLEAALKGESYEIDTMYPDFIKTAETDKEDGAKKSFNWAFETEKKHKELYQKAIDALDKNKVKELSKKYYVCPKCGNTYTQTNVEETCAFCGTGKDKFIEISWKDKSQK